MLVDEAWELLDATPARAAALARRALSARADAVDAYVVLAATREIDAEAIALLREAVRIGTRAAVAHRRGGPEGEGEYNASAHARAMNNLARLLRRSPREDDRTEALGHARRALRLDPDDRAGTRLLLMAWEAADGHWPRWRALVRRHRREHRTEVRFWLAFAAFRETAAVADALLADAIALNPHVPAALLGRVIAMRLPEDSYVAVASQQTRSSAKTCPDAAGRTALPAGLEQTPARPLVVDTGLQRAPTSWRRKPEIISVRPM